MENNKCLFQEGLSNIELKKCFLTVENLITFLKSLRSTVISTFSEVDVDGEFKFCHNLYELFAREVFEIIGLLEKTDKLDGASDTVLVANEISKENIKEYSDHGIKA